MIWRCAISVCLSFALAGGQALAQVETRTGSLVGQPKAAEIPANVSDEEQIQTLIREFARCTYAMNPKGVSQALLLAPGKDQFALEQLATSECLDSGKLEFSTSVYRGALFSELVRRRNARQVIPWTLPVQPLDLANPPSSDAPYEARVNFFMLSLAECMVETAPGPVRQIVLERTASTEQNRAFKEIIPLLGPCVPDGMTLKLNRMVLEHAFAEYLYRAQGSAAPSLAGSN